jgi:hypothetical protein
MSKIIQYSKEFKQKKREISELSPSIDKSKYRIVTKNLVYIIGLSESIADKEILMKYEYLGQYGKILKIIINKKNAYNQGNKFGPSFGAYITFSDPSEASIAILSIDKVNIDNHVIRANFGTTKYCQYYLSKNKCTHKNCVFLHKKANPEDIINRDDLNSNTNYFFNQQIYAIKLADIYNPKVKEKLLLTKNTGIKTIFPSPYLIYQNEIVIENTPKVKKINKFSVPKEEKEEKKNENENLINIKSDPINIIHINELETSYSTSNCLTSSLSSKSIEAPNNSLNNNINNKLFSTREKSRFDFVNINNNKEIEIPEFVSKINELSFRLDYLMNINQKIKNKFNNNIYLYTDELNMVNHKNENELNWRKFLLDNNSN